MGFYERREAILKLLERGKKVTLRELAVRFEVSRKTILNDIMHLTEHHRIAVEYGRCGGYFLTDGGKVTLSREQAAAIYPILQAHRAELSCADEILAILEHVLSPPKEVR